MSTQSYDPTEPFYRALADLKHWAEVLGVRPSAIAISNISEPPAPDWSVERQMVPKDGLE
jgi:hypothetical protein